MKFILRRFIPAYALFLIFGFMPQFSVAQEVFRAGFAERDITPAAGMEVPGGYGKQHNEGAVHDSLKARAAVFDDGTKIVALVGIDAVAIPEHLVKRARKSINESTGIPEQAILIAASHTHSGGPIDGVREGEYDHASEEVQVLAYEQSTMEDNLYIEMVYDAIVAAVEDAFAKRQDALASLGSGYEDRVAFNRRFFMKNGLTWTHPSGFGGLTSDEIVKVAGPIDPEVGVIGVWNPDGQLMGCVVNYANHCTNGMPGISADYVYYIELAVRSLMGEQAILVFLNGACGDITQVDNLSSDDTEFGVRSARFIGTSIGAEVLKVLVDAEQGNALTLDYGNRQLNIPHRKPAPKRVEACRQLVRQDPEEVGYTDWVFAKEILLLDAMIQKEDASTFEIQAIQVGPAVFIATPAEMFCQIGLDIKQGSKFPLTWVVELANGCIGYVPDEKAFAADGGGYETRLTSYSNLVINAGTQIEKACVELVNSLMPGDVILPPQKKPGVAPWSYGTVAPELE